MKIGDRVKMSDMGEYSHFKKVDGKTGVICGECSQPPGYMTDAWLISVDTGDAFPSVFAISKEATGLEVIEEGGTMIEVGTKIKALTDGNPNRPYVTRGDEGVVVARLPEVQGVAGACLVVSFCLDVENDDHEICSYSEDVRGIHFEVIEEGGVELTVPVGAPVVALDAELVIELMGRVGVLEERQKTLVDDADENGLLDLRDIQRIEALTDRVSELSRVVGRLLSRGVAEECGGE